MHVIKLCGRQSYCSRTVHRTHNHFIRKKYIKNGSHDTIHAFKNYFITVFSVFNKISYIQMDPKYVWLGGERGRKWWDCAVFSSGPSKFNPSKMKRKLGENRWVDRITHLPLILPHNNIINSTLCIFFSYKIFKKKLSIRDMRINLYNLLFLSFFIFPIFHPSN